MSDARDDEALTWEGDDRLQAPVAPPLRRSEPRTGTADPDTARTGDGLALVALGIFGGIALIETIGWSRTAFSGPLATTLTPGDGSPLALASFVAALLGHAAAVVAPLVWAAVVALRVRATTPRIAWFALGAVVLLPWPVVLGIS